MAEGGAKPCCMPGYTHAGRRTKCFGKRLLALLWNFFIDNVILSAHLEELRSYVCKTGQQRLPFASSHTDMSAATPSGDFPKSARLGETRVPLPISARRCPGSYVPGPSIHYWFGQPRLRASAGEGGWVGVDGGSPLIEVPKWLTPPEWSLSV